MPILADISVPWIIVAMIFISFLRFVLDRFKATEDLEQDVDQPARPPHPRPLEPPPVPAKSSSADSAAEEFRRLLKTLQEAQQPPPPPRSSQERSRPVPAPTPPPPPAPAPSRTPAPRPVSTREHEAALAFRQHAAKPAPSAAPSQTPTLAVLLSDPAAIRHAVILREVLGPPIALQPHDAELH